MVSGKAARIITFERTRSESLHPRNHDLENAASFLPQKMDFVETDETKAAQNLRMIVPVIVRPPSASMGSKRAVRPKALPATSEAVS